MIRVMTIMVYGTIIPVLFQIRLIFRSWVRREQPFVFEGNQTIRLTNDDDTFDIRGTF